MYKSPLENIQTFQYYQGTSELHESFVSQFPMEYNKIPLTCSRESGEASANVPENHVNCAKRTAFLNNFPLLFILGFVNVIVLVWVSVLQTEVSHLQQSLSNSSQVPVIQTPSQVKRDSGFCLDCSELKHVYLNGGSMKITKYFTIDEEKKMCCVRNFQDFWTFVKAVAERKVNIEMIKGNLCRQSEVTGSAKCTKEKVDKPAAHLVRGGPAYLLHHDTEGQELREWLDDRDKGFRTGLGYQDGRLVVLDTGKYYVYSQVFFVQTFARTNDLASFNGLESSDSYAGGSNRVWHAIYRFNEDYPNNHEDSLLRNAQTKCWSKKKDFELRTSYLGAVLSLRAGDQVMVRVSNVSLVSSETQSTYFGMYKI